MIYHIFGLVTVIFRKRMCREKGLLTLCSRFRLGLLFSFQATAAQNADGSVSVVVLKRQKEVLPFYLRIGGKVFSLHPGGQQHQHLCVCPR